jgi:PAS domain S-box-containing protein
MLIEDGEKLADTLDPENLKIARQLNIKSMICVPMVYEGRSMGVLAVDSLKEDRPFYQGDINILSAVAAQTVIGIMNVRAYQDLRSSEEKHRTLVETIRDIVYTVDLEGRFTYISPMAEIIAGYSTSDLIGRKFEDVIISSQHDAVRKNFEESLASEKGGSYQVQLVARDGKEIPFEINTTMLFDAQGQPIGRIGVARPWRRISLLH